MKSHVRGAIVVSLVIQGIGTFTPFFTIIGLARLAGPVVQGTFSTFKTWADLVSSIVVFGFPQAFVYLLNKGFTSRDRLLNFSLFYVFISTIFVIPFALYGVMSGYNILPQSRSPVTYAILVSAGVGAITLNRLVRAIYLTIDDGFLFSLITSAPAFFLFTTTMIAAQFAVFAYDLAFFAAGLLTVAAVGIWILRIIAETPNYRLMLGELPKRALAEQSLHIFAQSISFTLLPVATIYLLFHFGAAISDIALFTTATITISAVNAFFGIVAPILFNRWSANLDSTTFRAIQTVSDRVAAAFLIIGFVAVPVYPFVVPLTFGTNYIPAITTFQIISFAAAPVALTRMIASAIHAAGRPDVNSISCALRLTVAVVTQLGLSYSAVASPLAAAAVGWVIAEWTAAAYSRWMERKITLYLWRAEK